MDAERERKLSSVVASTIHEAGLYRFWPPQALGGFELDPVSGLRIIEAVARIDSADGWNLQIAVAHDLFAPWFSDRATAEIFHADAIAVGAFNPRARQFRSMAAIVFRDARPTSAARTMPRLLSDSPIFSTMAKCVWARTVYLKRGSSPCLPPRPIS